MIDTVGNRRSLLTSNARIQAPWIKVTIGSFTFGVFSKSNISKQTKAGFYTAYKVQYPSYVKSLSITKINGQVNQYSLQISYPVKTGEDPNFFEKVFSSVSDSRKIVFSYGDASMPDYVYKDEEAIITDIKESFSFGNNGAMSSAISYTVSAVSCANLGQQGSFTFTHTKGKLEKPSDEIKRVFKNSRYGLQSLFTGMSSDKLSTLIAGDDKAVQLDTKTNIAPVDYINYLVNCMVPASSTEGNSYRDIYILTIHDESIYDKLYSDAIDLRGPYFKVTRMTSAKKQAEAYEIDIGTMTSTIVTNFSVADHENYSLYYSYQNELTPESYVRRIDNQGLWEDTYAPVISSKNELHATKIQDAVWWSRMTQYPISASVTIQGLLRPATLMTYVRLNVIFPGGQKHITSGLYIITSQKDEINESGYRTTLGLTRISD